MKGIVFNYLEEFTSNIAGEEVWDKIIDECELKTVNGIFISPEVYPDDDLFQIVNKACELLKADINDVIYNFGQFTVEKFWQEYPVFFENMSNSKDFLLSVHSVIHVEVEKMYPDAITPDFEYRNVTEDRMQMIYNSKRNLCYLAKGMIDKLGEYFNEEINLHETNCKLKGDPNCIFNLRFSKRTEIPAPKSVQKRGFLKRLFRIGRKK